MLKTCFFVAVITIVDISVIHVIQNLQQKFAFKIKFKIKLCKICVNAYWFKKFFSLKLKFKDLITYFSINIQK